MNIRSQLSEHEFARTLSEESVRTFQIIYAGLMMGTVLLTTVGFFAVGTPAQTADLDEKTALMFSMANFLFCLTAFTAAAVVPKRMLSDSELERSLEKSASPYETAFQLIRTMMIVRIALVEGAALFGLTAVITAVPLPLMEKEPAYLLNVVPFVLFLMYGAGTFPTKERLASLFRSQILQRG